MAKRKGKSNKNKPDTRDTHACHQKSFRKKRFGIPLVWKSFVVSIIASLIASYIFYFSPHSFRPSHEFTFKNIPATFSDNISNRIDDAIKCYELGRYTDALAHLNSVILSLKKSEDLKRQQALIYALRGACHLKLDHLNEAKDSFEKSLTFLPSAFAHKSLSDIYYQIYQKTKKQSDLEMHKSHSDKAYNLKTSSIISRKKSLNNSNLFNSDKFLSKNINGKVHLVSVGIDQYFDPRIKQLRFAKNDAKDIIKTFNNLYSSKLKIHELLGKNATKEKVLSTINEIKSIADKNDLIIFYYSGHGIEDIGENLTQLVSSNSNIRNLLNEFKDNSLRARYILPFDADIDKLKQSTISVSEVSSVLKSACTKSAPLLIVDACYADASTAISKKRVYTPSDLSNFIGSSKQKVFQRNELGNLSDINELSSDVIFIGSSSAGQFAAESSNYQNGVFTHFLITSLKELSDSDENKDTEISKNELIKSIQSEMTNYLSKKGISQDISFN